MATATSKAPPTITTRDGTVIYYKDWGSGQPIVFSHGWPLSADAWDEQLDCFASNGFRANREGSTVSQGVLDAFWLMSMQAGFKGAYACIKSRSTSSQAS